MALTRNEIVNRVMGYIGLSPNDSNYSAMISKCRSWLNTVLLRVANDRRWPELETTKSDASLASGASTLALVDDCQFLTGPPKITGGDYEPLEWLSPSRFDERYYQTLEDGDTGRPTAATRKGRTIYFNYVADADYTIQYDYYKRITLFGETDADSNDTSEIKDIDDVLVHLVTAQAFKDIRKFQEGNDHYQHGMAILMGHDSDIGGNPNVVEPYIVSAGDGTYSEERHWK